MVLHSSENSIALGGPWLGAEHLVELDYKSSPTLCLLVQPVVQWFVQPGATPPARPSGRRLSPEDPRLNLIQPAKA
jgi:hypothetical protein